jgi:hypothetical protein
MTVSKINEMIVKKKYNVENKFNTDQTKINYEEVSKRTLSYKGEKDTYCINNNQNAMTHSFTLQLIISRDGRLGD